MHNKRNYFFQLLSVWFSALTLLLSQVRFRISIIFPRSVVKIPRDNIIIILFIALGTFDSFGEEAGGFRRTKSCRVWSQIPSWFTTKSSTNIMHTQSVPPPLYLWITRYRNPLASLYWCNNYFWFKHDGVELCRVKYFQYWNTCKINGSLTVSGFESGERFLLEVVPVIEMRL